MFLFMRYGLYSTIQWIPFSLGLLSLACAVYVAHRTLRCPHCNSLAVLKHLTLMENGKKTICPNCKNEILYGPSTLPKEPKKKKK